MPRWTPCYSGTAIDLGFSVVGGGDHLLIGAPAGANRFLILGYELQAAAGTTARFYSGTTPIGTHVITITGGRERYSSNVGIAMTADDDALRITTSGNVTGSVRYVVVAA